MMMLKMYWLGGASPSTEIDAGHAKLTLESRYYGDAVLGCLHRRMAIEQWMELRNGHELDLERALTAFDMFVLHDGEGDFNDVNEDSLKRTGPRIHG